jgi:hypothetical protein
MKLPIACHEWLVSTCYAGAQKQGAAAPVPFWLDAHRNRRGPFTAAGSLIRAIIDDATCDAGLVSAHLLTLLSVAPEIGHYVGVPADVRQALIVSREGNPPSWTRRIANGVTDFILGYFEGERSGRVAVFTNVDDADPTDQEFISVLLRRADPETAPLMPDPITWTRRSLLRSSNMPGDGGGRRAVPESWKCRWFGLRG